MPDQITEIKKYRAYYRIILDTGAEVRVAPAVLREHPLKTGQLFDEIDYIEKTSATAYKKAMERAVWLLSRRDYSEQALINKLKDGAFNLQTIRKVCDFLIAGHYLDDARFAENFIARRKSKSGSRKMEMDLRHKGIQRETAQAALEDINPEEEIESASKLAKKYISSKSLEPLEAFDKCASYLARRGYSWDTVKAAYRMAQESEDESNPE